MVPDSKTLSRFSFGITIMFSNHFTEVTPGVIFCEYNLSLHYLVGYSSFPRKMKILHATGLAPEPETSLCKVMFAKH